MKPNAPIDTDGHDLARLVPASADTSRPIAIVFTVVATDKSSGSQVAVAATSAGYEARVVEDDEGPDVWVFCRKSMPPTHRAIVEARSELDRIAQPFGGYTDHWAFEDEYVYRPVRKLMVRIISGLLCVGFIVVFATVLFKFFLGQSDPLSSDMVADMVVGAVAGLPVLLLFGYFAWKGHL